MEQREFDLVVWGATGFTGALVAEYLNERYGAAGELRWALAGRSQQKLEALRDELGSNAPPLLIADAEDQASLNALVTRTRVVITTVGPYQLYGSSLVAACAAAGTDYVDLCGEPTWMHAMIAAHHTAAAASGARIVFSCGFDSIPFDLGVFYLQQEARKRFGRVLPRVKGRVRGMTGAVSGGTVASFKATMTAAMKNPSLIGVLIDPFALAPGFSGPEQPDDSKPKYDASLESWVAPFVMAVINTKNIHRSNQLLGHWYGEDFRYDEMIVTGPGERGEAAAIAVSKDKGIQRSKLQPGEGPSKAERESGSYDLLFIGEGADGVSLRVSVKGDRDPGYGSTSRMIAESAICLAKHPDLGSGGVWTPAAILGDALIDRLQSNAGIRFEVEA